jgi:hypothetical protein
MGILKGLSHVKNLNVLTKMDIQYSSGFFVDEPLMNYTHCQISAWLKVPTCRVGDTSLLNVQYKTKFHLTKNTFLNK